ncbi:MAG: CocE/NonD family hydrolase [Bacteroidales bacterium]
MRTRLLVLLLTNSFILSAQNPDSLYLVKHYNKAEYRIPMRDGKTLFTVVYSPKDTSMKYPVLFNRTPYSVAPYGDRMGISFYKGLSASFLKEGFIFVYQDVRGRFMSEGNYEHMRPFIREKKDAQDVDENSDAWDSMDWLIKNLTNHNGNIGMWGISYPGFYTSYAAVNAHPALKCVSPQAPIADWFFDDAHHHGAFFLSAMMDFVAAMDVPRKGLYQDWIEPYDYQTSDGYEFFMRMTPLSNVKVQYFGDSIRFWNELVNHPDYDEFWKSRNLLPHLQKITPAVLVVGGWYDAEDLYGTFNTYQTIEQNNPGIRNNLVIGPWIHGGWARTNGSSLGNVSFGGNNSAYYRDSIELPFFNYYLKGKGSLNLPEATMFMTGRNVWGKYPYWPPREAEIQRFYFHFKNSLSMEPPISREVAYEDYISDPWKPVPYTESIFFGMTREYMTDDQRFAARRPDVLYWQTPPLEEELILAGPLRAVLNVMTSGDDADWVVKIIDVYPDTAKDNPTTRAGMHMAGYQQMVRSEVIRGRYRNSYSLPERFPSGQVEEIVVNLQDVLHCFKKGHRLMVQVQNSWFPLVDINPQQYVPNIFKADKGNFIRTTNRVYHAPGKESWVECGVLKP